MFFNICSDHKQTKLTTHNIYTLCCEVLSLHVSRDQADAKNMSLHDHLNNKDNSWGESGATGVAYSFEFYFGSWTPEWAAMLSDYLPSISSLMMEKQQLHPDWCCWRPAAPGLILSPLPGACLSLASAKGHRYTVLRPCPAPAYLIGGQEWPRRACQGPLSVGPRHQTQGPTLTPLLFEALGRLIGLLCRAPLWGSAQACSSCWVCRRRKEQRLIPLQVSLSVATLHFQWLGKVTSALDKPVQEPHKQHQLKKYIPRSQQFTFLLSLVELSRAKISTSGNSRYSKIHLYQSCNLNPKLHFAHINSLDDPATAAEQSNTHPHNAVYHQFSLDYGLMVKWITTNMQMYISYLHSRFQQGVLIIRKYMGHYGELWASLQLCRSHTNSSPADFRWRGFSPHIFPHTPAANTKTQAKNFLECTLNFEFNVVFFFKLKVSGFYAKAFGLKPF